MMGFTQSYACRLEKGISKAHGIGEGLGGGSISVKEIKTLFKEFGYSLYSVHYHTKLSGARKLAHGVYERKPILAHIERLRKNPRLVLQKVRRKPKCPG